MSRDLSKYRQAAGAYIGLGVAIVLLTTFFIPSSHYRSGFIPLIVGVLVLLGFAYFVSKGIRWLAIGICALSAMRTGWWMYSFFAFGSESTSWVYAACAVLNGGVVLMLLRAVIGGRLPSPSQKSMSGALS